MRRPEISYMLINRRQAYTNWKTSVGLVSTLLCGRPSDCWSFKLKIGTPVVPVLGNFHENLDFYGTNGETDRRTDGRARHIVRTIRKAAQERTIAQYRINLYSADAQEFCCTVASRRYDAVSIALPDKLQMDRLSWSFLLRAKAECFARLCHRLGVRRSVCLSVCPSVCLSHSWSVSKRCKLGSRNLHCGLPRGL